MRLRERLINRSLYRRVARREDGFTMIFALVALFISGLLVAAAFTAANGDIKLTRTATLQAKAYYAALAGVQRYQHELSSNPNYWVQCEEIGTEASPKEVTGTTDEKYFVKTLPSSKYSACEKEKQTTILETTGSAKGTFRILSTGVAGAGAAMVKRKIVATFSHPGFTKYVYESNYEVEDPTNFEPEPEGCEHYYSYRKEHKLTSTCPAIQFASEDKVNGPMHTNDAAAVCSNSGKAPTFGRNSEDPIEMNGGHYAAGGSCGNEPNIVGKYSESAGTLLPPETDAELLETAGLKFSGRVELTLKSGSPNTITYTTPSNQTPTTVPFPENGVVFVENSASGCGVTKYTPFGSDTENDSGCGNVYVHGSYTESLTIASANDVIVNGNLTTSSEASGEPVGGGTLGLIAQNFVRVYHPVKKGYTTSHAEPATEAPFNGKCVTKKELSGKILKSTEVGEITTTGLAVGAEVEGSGIEAGTTITEIKAASKVIKLSKAAKPSVKETSGKLTNGSTEVKEITTTGLEVGQEVEGSGIEAGTTITEIKAASKVIKLSKAAKVTVKETSGKILKSTEVKEITTTGLAVGMEVEGSGIEAGTTITEIKAASKVIKLSKAAKPSVKEVTGKITSGSTEVKEITTTGLEVGQEVEGSGIEAGTTITEIKAASKVIKLSKAAKKTENTKLKFYGETPNLKFFEPTVTLKFYGETTTLKFLVSTGYAYNSALNVCHKVESGYSEYRESENLYIKSCESESSYTGNAYCTYENNSEGCTSKATNLSKEEDPNGWGKLENPVIDAAILSTKHSWIVDNYKCGAQLGKLTVWGSIAQYWRGPVGTAGGSGYIKNYNYDERLASQQPPNFLSPSSTSWSLSRETVPPSNFTG